MMQFKMKANQSIDMAPGNLKVVSPPSVGRKDEGNGYPQSLVEKILDRHANSNKSAHHVPAPQEPTIAATRSSNQVNTVNSYWDLKKKFVIVSSDEVVYKVCPKMKENKKVQHERSCLIWG